MKIYEFNQNNSGGSFDADDKLCNSVFIEANTATEANEIAEGVGIYFNGCATGADCSCCGDRWYEVDGSDAIDVSETNFDNIEDYIQSEVNKGSISWTNPDARLFYKNGEIKEFIRTK